MLLEAEFTVVVGGKEGAYTVTLTPKVLVHRHRLNPIRTRHGNSSNKIIIINEMKHSRPILPPRAANKRKAELKIAYAMIILDAK